MKKAVLLLGFLLISLGAFAQEGKDIKRSDLQGPAYKNYKYGKHQTTPVKLYAVNKKKSLTGPAYKNYKPGKEEAEVKKVLINTSGHERQKLTGPAYKNYKPGKKSN